jgi:hypothetical protein
MMFSQRCQYERAATSPALAPAPVQVMTPMTALVDLKEREYSNGGNAHALAVAVAVAVAALTAATQTLIGAGREGVAVGLPTQINQERAVFGAAIEVGIEIEIGIETGIEIGIEIEIEIGTKVWTRADTEKGVGIMTGEKMMIKRKAIGFVGNSNVKRRRGRRRIDVVISIGIGVESDHQISGKASTLRGTKIKIKIMAKIKRKILARKNADVPKKKQF